MSDVGGMSMSHGRSTPKGKVTLQPLGGAGMYADIHQDSISHQVAPSPAIRTPKPTQKPARRGGRAGGGAGGGTGGGAGGGGGGGGGSVTQKPGKQALVK